ncbi:hypothetical protein K8R42_02695 [bacterium]|nr:hypothetical protein [bacterium]
MLNKNYIKVILLSLLVIPANWALTPVFVWFGEITGMPIGDFLVGISFALDPVGILISLFLLYIFPLLIVFFIGFIVTRSFKMTLIVLISAIVIQIIMGMFAGAKLNEVAGNLARDEFNAEQEYRNSVTLGEVDFKLLGQVLNPNVYPQYEKYGPYYEKLVLIIPMNAKVADDYRIEIDYQYNSYKISKEENISLKKGNNTVEFEITTSDLSKPGYWNTGADSNVEISVFKWTSEQEILGDDWKRNTEKSYWEITEKEFKLKNLAVMIATE